MARLSVNIDHVATVRQARRGARPDPVQAAVIAELAGAAGITCHLRGDRRHIQDRDLERLRAAVTTRLNVEMAARASMAAVARRVRPDLVTLVPERPGEVTTQGGIDVARGGARLRRHIGALRRARLAVSLFVDPDPDQIAAAADSGAGMVELNTDAYARAASPRSRARAFDRLVVAARLAAEAGLAVAAGHALDAGNVRPVADIPEVEELNIGHAIVARAVLVGLERAVREMIDAIGD